MTHISYDPRGVNARFCKNDKNQVSIEFFDPSYTRAETILFEASTRHAHALLHEGVFAIGQVPQELESLFGQGGEVLLCADHYCGHKVGLKAKIAVS